MYLHLHVYMSRPKDVKLTELFCNTFCNLCRIFHWTWVIKSGNLHLWYVSWAYNVMAFRLYLWLHLNLLFLFFKCLLVLQWLYSLNFSFFLNFSLLIWFRQIVFQSLVYFNSKYRRLQQFSVRHIPHYLQIIQFSFRHFPFSSHQPPYEDFCST